MSQMVLSLPVSLEQIASVLKQLGYDELLRLIDLVPSLRYAATDTLSPQQLEQIDQKVEQVRSEIFALYDHQPVSLNEHFLKGMTVGEYLSLSDTEESKLWDQLAEVDLMEIEEVDAIAP